MDTSQFYLPSNIPQWGIFLGVVFVIISYIDKKDSWAYAGLGVLIATGLVSLGYNLFGQLEPKGNISELYVKTLVATGWQSAIGGALAAVALLFLRLKKRNYKILATLTLIYFIVIFFEFNYLHSLTKKSTNNTETVQ